jgi:hypothetical protein
MNETAYFGIYLVKSNDDRIIERFIKANALKSIDELPKLAFYSPEINYMKKSDYKLLDWNFNSKDVLSEKFYDLNHSNMQNNNEPPKNIVFIVFNNDIVQDLKNQTKNFYKEIDYKM